MSNQFPPSDPFHQPARQFPGQQTPHRHPSHQDPGNNNTMILIIVGVAGAVVILAGGLMLALLMQGGGAGGGRGMGGAPDFTVRANNLKQVGLGIHNYHSAYKQLPSTIIADPDGQELSGWRIGLSPFIEAQSQWENFMNNFGPSARDLIADDPPNCLQAPDGERGETRIFAISSPESMFPPEPNAVVKFRNVLDGLANTVMAIELPNRSANWTSNTNMTPDEAYQALQELGAGENGFILMGDGAVISVDGSLDRGLFDALVTKAGKEPIDELLTDK